jgi:hypothetical protein
MDWRFIGNVFLVLSRAKHYEGVPSLSPSLGARWSGILTPVTEKASDAGPTNFI